MEQDSQSIKQQIQGDYNQTIGALGTAVYRLCVPWLEILEHMQKCVVLNRRMHAILQDEKNLQKPEMKLADPPPQIPVDERPQSS